jgi:hypothetical protein
VGGGLAGRSAVADMEGTCSSSSSSSSSLSSGLAQVLACVCNGSASFITIVGAASAELSMHKCGDDRGNDTTCKMCELPVVRNGSHAADGSPVSVRSSQLTSARGHAAVAEQLTDRAGRVGPEAWGMEVARAVVAVAWVADCMWCKGAASDMTLACDATV